VSTTLAPASSPIVSAGRPAPSAQPVAPPTPTGSCDVCGHALTGHDTIASRYCSATQANALTRGCICSSGKS